MSAALAEFGILNAAAGVFGAAFGAFSRGLSAPAGPAIRFAPEGASAAIAAAAASQSISDLGKALVPMLFVAVGAVSLHYVLLFVQSRAGFKTMIALRQEARAKGERGPDLAVAKYSQHKGTLWADRSVGNYMEQLPPFFVGLVSYALFVSANNAAVLGWAWIGFRALYPFLFGQMPAIFVSTIPAYSIVWYMLSHASYNAYVL
jgi:hypothetical protein